MELRVVQWNIKHNSDAMKIASKLNSVVRGNTLIQLQEVTTSNFQLIEKQLSASDSVLSLNYRVPGPYEGKNRALGVATFLFGGIIKDSFLLNRTLFPERTMVVDAVFDACKIRALNFHSLTGVGYKHGKASNFASIADYIADHEIDIFSCDANEPMVDDLDIDKVLFFDNGDKGRCASLLFGKNKVHPLEDVWRNHHKAKGDLQVESPISYIIQGKIFKRYDFIYALPEHVSVNIEYQLEESIKASSDHAMVLADLQISNG